MCDWEKDRKPAATVRRQATVVSTQACSDTGETEQPEHDTPIGRKTAAQVNCNEDGDHATQASRTAREANAHRKRPDSQSKK